MAEKLTSKAWIFDQLGGPGDLVQRDEELGELAPGEVRLRIKCAGLNRSDLMWMAGRYIMPPQFPGAHVGQEAVGEIVELGPPSDDAKPPAGFEPQVGDRVGLLVGRVDFQGMGTYRDVGTYPQAALLPVPDNLSDEQGAALWVAALTAIGGWHAAGVDASNASGRTALVTAASSGVGVVALQVARAWGARTIAVTTSDDKAEALRQHADEVIVSTKHDGSGDGFAAAVLDATDGQGFDAAFDPVGFANASALSESAGTGAQIVFYGIMAGTQADLDLVSMLRKNLGLHGYTVYRLFGIPGALDAAINATVSLCDSGALEPVVAASYSLDHAPRALEALAENQHLGKIVLTA